LVELSVFGLENIVILKPDNNQSKALKHLKYYDTELKFLFQVYFENGKLAPVLDFVKAYDVVFILVFFKNY